MAIFNICSYTISMTRRCHQQK